MPLFKKDHRHDHDQAGTAAPGGRHDPNNIGSGGGVGTGATGRRQGADAGMGQQDQTLGGGQGYNSGTPDSGDVGHHHQQNLDSSGQGYGTGAGNDPTYGHGTGAGAGAGTAGSGMAGVGSDRGATHAGSGMHSGAGQGVEPGYGAGIGNGNSASNGTRTGAIPPSETAHTGMGGAKSGEHHSSGKMEKTIGSIIGSSSLKQKGLQKEQEANTIKMQSAELGEAERLEKEALMRRERAVAHGAHPDNRHLGASTG